MSKAVLFSINKPHTDNIKAGLKRSELRKRPPKVAEAYKGYIYETMKYGGCGAVIGEFTAINKERWRICVGIPLHLCANACVSADEIRKYSRNGLDDVTEIAISDLVIYDEPKELSEFMCESNQTFDSPQLTPLKRPPQSWCYVEELK